MSYTPKVNDYVKWKKSIEGWIYFKCPEYITIEMSVRPKHKDDYQNSSIHRNQRLLVLCYQNEWSQLKYIKTRQSVHE